MQGNTLSQTAPRLRLSQKRIRILKNGEERVQPISRGFLLVEKFLTWRSLRGATLKFQTASWIL